jgi:hypothetical protein
MTDALSWIPFLASARRSHPAPTAGDGAPKRLASQPNQQIAKWSSVADCASMA